MLIFIFLDGFFGVFIDSFFFFVGFFGYFEICYCEEDDFCEYCEYEGENF